MDCEAGVGSCSGPEPQSALSTASDSPHESLENSEPKGKSSSVNDDAASRDVVMSDCPSNPLQTQPDEQSAVQAMANSKKRRKLPIKVKRTAGKSKWNAENIMVDSKSPLASCDLRTVLSSPAAWDVLDEHDRSEVLALFPDRKHILETGPDGPRPDFQALRNDDSFRHDCATYTGNIAEGRHDPDWLQQAWAAHERRKLGEFDGYLVKKFEETWGMELPEEMKPRRQAVTSASSGQTESSGDKEMVGNEEQKDGNRAAVQGGQIGSS